MKYMYQALNHYLKQLKTCFLAILENMESTAWNASEALHLPYKPKYIFMKFVEDFYIFKRISTDFCKFQRISIIFKTSSYGFFKVFTNYYKFKKQTFFNDV